MLCRSVATHTGVIGSDGQDDEETLGKRLVCGGVAQRVRLVAPVASSSACHSRALHPRRLGLVSRYVRCLLPVMSDLLHQRMDVSTTESMVTAYR